MQVSKATIIRVFVSAFLGFAVTVGSGWMWESGGDVSQAGLPLSYFTSSCCIGIDTSGPSVSFHPFRFVFDVLVWFAVWSSVIFGAKAMKAKAAIGLTSIVVWWIIIFFEAFESFDRQYRTIVSRTLLPVGVILLLVVAFQHAISRRRSWRRRGAQ